MHFSSSGVHALTMFANQRCARLEGGCRVQSTFSKLAEQLSEDIFLVIAAWWLVQSGIDAYRFFSNVFKEDNNRVERAEQLQLLVKKVYANTLKGAASLVFASIGAGIGATLFHPSAGQWIGCTVGDLAGPVVLSFCLEKFFRANI
ncbi:hypothetical protein RHMOL_Rhmol04G0015000 [Rhododendron molle]|uniref:Uncharacterized protein n=1 Tax=Rhododendron molle TaxID=49168 RepID=A0ACC0NW08_RHOML|nr:hypothetical protein RHMOL_Rhmol04G0015000 [Rhododendron molle]